MSVDVSSGSRRSLTLLAGVGNPGHRNRLSQCKVGSVDGMRGDHPPAKTTVYLTVAC